MLAEIFVAEDDLVWMTSVVGVPKSCVKAFFAQGIYLYQFDELPDAIIEVLHKTRCPGRGRSETQFGLASAYV